MTIKNIKSKDKIIEIGAVKYDIKNGSKEYFSQLINPVVQISEFIEDLTGISNSDVENMPIIDEVKNEFEEFYSDFDSCLFKLEPVSLTGNQDFFTI